MSSKEDEAALKATARKLTLGGLATFALLAWLIGGGRVDLSGGTRPSDLVSAGDRLAFTLRWLTLPVTCLVVAMFLVIRGRLGSGALNPLKGPEQRIQAQKNVMQNTLEQLIMSAAGQLILSTHLSPQLVLRLIPLCSVSFVLGRIAFVLGYPEKRSLGIVLNMVPMVFVTAYNVYAFFVFLKLV